MIRKISKFVSDIKRTEYMEYIIYCDESVSDGKYYTDFFGGVLVRNTDYDAIKAAIDAKKAELNLKGICLILLECLKHGVVEIGIFLSEFWREVVGIAKHILIHKHLTVTTVACSYTYGEGRN